MIQIEKFNKYLKWFLFTGVISVFPIGLNYLLRKMSGTEFTFFDLISNGELLLVSTALATSGLAEMISFTKNEQDQEASLMLIVSGFFAIITLFISMGMYGYIASGLAKGEKDFILKVEIFVFFMAFMSGLYSQKFIK